MIYSLIRTIDPLSNDWLIEFIGAVCAHISSSQYAGEHLLDGAIRLHDLGAIRGLDGDRWAAQTVN